MAATDAVAGAGAMDVAAGAGAMDAVAGAEDTDAVAGAEDMDDGNSCQTEIINRCEFNHENNVFAKSENK